MARFIAGVPVHWRTMASALMVLTSALIVFELRIGEVVATISPTHGIHAGDPLALITLTVAVVVFEPRSVTGRRVSDGDARDALD